MREQLEALEELSRTDLTFRQVDVELGELDSRVTELRADVARMQELLGQEREQLAETERLRSSHVAELEAIAEKSERSKKRQALARNNREVEATTREIEVLKREKDERTAEKERLEQLITQVKGSIEKHAADVKQLTDLLAEQETQSGAQREELLGRKRDAEAGRKAITTRIRPDLMRQYTMVFNRRGTGVADLQQGICRGCHMSLPPQLANQILRLEKIFQCPNCQRLLIPRSVLTK